MIDWLIKCQRYGFNGPTIGPKPQEKNIREFSEEQLKAGQGIIGLQAGTNKCATQAGMGSGVRHVADIKVEDMDTRGAGHIGLQVIRLSTAFLWRGNSAADDTQFANRPRHRPVGEWIIV